MDSAYDTVPLRVVVNAPVITSRSPAKQIVFDGDSLALLCNANGIPEPKISWVFNKTRTNVMGIEYRVNKAISSDTGEYICEAKNAYGETKHAMEVEVITLPHFPPGKGLFINGQSPFIIKILYMLPASLVFHTVESVRLSLLQNRHNVHFRIQYVSVQCISISHLPQPSFQKR